MRTFANEQAQIAALLREVAAAAEADRNGVQQSALTRAIHAGDKVDLRAQLHACVLVAVCRAKVKREFFFLRFFFFSRTF